jgi:thiol-disulfide isomerase/thioredoxin
MSTITRGLSLALILALCGCGLAVAQEKQDSGSKIQVPDGTPKEILKFLQTQRPTSAADIEALVKGAEKVLNHPQAKDEHKSKAGTIAIGALYMGSTRHGMEARFEEYTAKVIKEQPGSDLAGTAAAYRWVKKNFKQGKIAEGGVDELWQLGKDYSKNELVGQLFAMAAQQIQDEKEAEAFLKKAIAALGAESETAKQMQGMLINKQLVGKEMDIVGPTLKGDSFNIASLKGKVVLVDFWATWCGPCIREMPNVKSAYEKYHDKGFEIVAISLDNKREALEKYVQQEKLPWTQIIFSEEKDMGWKNPLAKKFGITGIPATFLIGRDGKVIARDLRGEALEKAVKAEIEKGQ